MSVYLLALSLVIVLVLIIRRMAGNEAESKAKAIINAREAEILKRQRDNNVVDIDGASKFWVRKRKR